MKIPLRNHWDFFVYLQPKTKFKIMKLRLQFLSILLCVFFTSFSQVQTINVGTGNNFDPDTVTINLGDTIEFGTLGYHNAVEIDESTWIANDTTYNGGFYFSFGSPGGYFIADSAKTYYYICQPHASMAMKGVIIVNSAPTYGCTDILACNYNPNATVDDGSCAYPTDSTYVIASCDSFTWNVNSITYYTSTIDTVIGINAGGCLETNILQLTINAGGCMDSTATNYDSLATCDDGSCQYDSTCITFALFDVNGHLQVENTGCMPNNFNTGIAQIDTTGIGGSGSYNFGWYDAAGQLLDSSLTVSNLDTGSYILNIEDIGCAITLTHTFSVTYNYGCMDSTATNYDPLATCDDGSCVYYLPNHDNIFFSEWSEGSSWNKYFEIFNPTSDTIDLSDYALARVNGSPTTVGVYEYWNDFDSAAVILPYDVFVLAHSSSDSIILAQADMTVSATTSLSNGDDGMALVFGFEPNSPAPPSNTTYVIVDWIGDWNGDPGQGWDVAGVGAATRNHTIIRKCNVLNGDTSWLNSASNQWMVKPVDYWSNIGFHNYNTTVIDSQWYTICNGLSVTVGLNTYDSSGIYHDTLTSYNGCDSVVITDLTVLSASASIVVNNLTICDGDSVIVGSSVYFHSGTFSDTLTNLSGCDSIITTHLNVQVPVHQSYTICDGDSVVVGSSVYSSSGNYIDTLISSVGCDSIIYTEVIIYSQFNSVFGGITDNTVTPGGMFTGNRHLTLDSYLPTEIVSAVIYSQDSNLITFELRDNNGTVLQDTTHQLVPGAQRVDLNFEMLVGADYQLGVASPGSGLFRNNSGASFPYNFGSLASITGTNASPGYYYFYYDIEMRQLAVPTNYSICNGDSLTIGNSVYHSSGNYVDTLHSSIGCDSLVFTHLVVYPSYSDTNYQTICSGEIYSINGNVYDSTGIYQDTLSTIFGCDSIITSHLFVDSITGGMSINQQVICFGDHIVVGNSIYDSPGMYSDTLASANGCDSVVTTYLNVITANYPSLNGGLPDTSMYPGDFSNYNGYLLLDANILTLLKSATVYSTDTNSVTFELRNSAGFVMQSSTQMVYPGSQTLTFNFMIPAGTDYQLGIDGGNSGLFRNNAGNGNSISYPFNLGSVNITSSDAGDQYYYFYYDIEIMQFGSNNPQTICDGDSIVVGNSVYNTPGVYIDTFTSVNSCDSMVYTNLQYYPTTSLNISSMPSPAEICLGDTILLEASQGFSEFYWIYSNAIIGQNQNILLSPTEDTWYILKAIDQYGCVIQEDIWVYVDTCFVGLEDAIINNISIYPNPSFGIFNIEFNNVFDNNLNIRIVNSLGAIVISEELKEGQRIKEFNLSEFSKGIYFIELQTEIGIFKKKIILK